MKSLRWHSPKHICEGVSKKKKNKRIILQMRKEGKPALNVVRIISWDRVLN